MATLTAEVVKRTVRLTIGGRAGATFVIQRSSQYGLHPVRTGVQVDSPESWVGYDYEMPLDVPLTYIATDQATQQQISSNPVVAPSEGKDWWVAVAQPNLTQAVTIESFPALSYALAHQLVQPQASRYPIAVINARRSARGTLTLLTLTLGETGSLRTLIDRSPFFYLTGPPDRGFQEGGLYLLAGDVEISRTTRVAQEPSRRFAIAVSQVDRPPLQIVLPESNTLADWVAEGTTLAGWRARTYLDLLNEEDIGP